MLMGRGDHLLPQDFPDYTTCKYPNQTEGNGYFPRSLAIIQSLRLRGILLEINRHGTVCNGSGTASSVIL